MSGSRRRSTPADSLLNFSYPLPVSASSENASRRTSSRHAIPFNKKRHVRANFRFALSPSCKESDKMVSSVDLVDDPIDWDRVILVNQLVEHPPYCPICLDSLVAPRITKCGHSTCLKCILHYFSVSDRNYARCVLCAEPVYVGDLRCLTFDVCPSYQPKDNATFILCRRISSSSETVPVAPIATSSPFQFRSVILGFDLSSVYLKEQEDIVNGLLVAESDEVPYLRMALECTEKLLESSTQDILASVRNLTTASTISEVSNNNGDEREYYFYQSLDGQLLFLNSLSFRCLLHEYGSVTNLPHMIKGPIVDVVNVRQTVSMRSKHRFIAHLPITTNYSLCDIELKMLVKKSTLSHFREEITQQAKVRAKHKAQQKRDEKRMEAINQEKEKELMQRARVTGPLFDPLPFEMASPEDFGPAIGNAKPSGPTKAVGAWSAVADKGLLASEAWEPLPSRSRPQISTAALPERKTVSFSSVVGSQPALSAQIKAQKNSRTNILFSNAGNRQHKN